MIDRDKIAELSEARDGTCISMYAPMHRAGAPTRENPIRFKNRIQDAERYLLEAGWEPKSVEELLEPAIARIDDYGFWQHQRDGLATLICDGELHEVQLPLAPPELTVIGPRFHLKPMLPVVTEDQLFWVLAVSLNQFRLFRATRYGIEQVDLPEDTPESIQEFDKYEDFEKSQHFKAVGAQTQRGRPDESVHYGTGDADVEASRQERLLRLFRALDNGVREVIAGTEEPLVFIGVDYLFPLYRDANQYPHLFPQNVEGNPDQWEPHDVHARAWDVVAEHFDRNRNEAMRRYEQQVGTGNTSDDLGEIVTATTDGRVDTLIVGLDAHQWGWFDVHERSVTLADPNALESYDLLDFAAVETVRTGGAVFAVPRDQVPGDGDMVAIYRF